MAGLLSWNMFSMDSTQGNHTIYKLSARTISLRNQVMLRWNKNIQLHALKLFKVLTLVEFVPWGNDFVQSCCNKHYYMFAICCDLMLILLHLQLL